MEWSNKRTLELIDLYKLEPVLWNPKHPNHRKSHNKYCAWEGIKANLSWKVTVQELKVKMKSVTTYYKRHLKKALEAGTSTNEVYQTNWFAFEKMNSFLSPIYKSQSTTYAQQASEKKDTQKSINTKETIIEKETKPSIEIKLQDNKRNDLPPKIMEPTQQTQKVVNDIDTNNLEKLEFFTKFLESKIRSISDPTTQRHLINDLTTLCLRAEEAYQALQHKLSTIQSPPQQTLASSIPSTSQTSQKTSEQDEQILKSDESSDQNAQTSQMPSKVSQITITSEIKTKNFIY